MTDNAPSLDQWRRLYELALSVRGLKPWTWMEEVDLFGIQEPGTEELGFVSVMGMRGEHFAVAVLRGAQALHAYMDLHHTLPTDSAARLMEIPQLQLSFENKEALEEEDQQVLSRLGQRFRGEHAWPLFRSLRPGRLPWFLEAGDVGLFACALEQTLEVAPRFYQDPDLLYPEEEDHLLLRVPTRRRDAIVWKDEYRPISPPASAPPEETALDFFSLSRFKRLSRHDRVLEADLFMLWSGVREGDGPPVYPYALLIVDADSAEIVAHDLMTPEPTLEAMWRSVPLRLVQRLEAVGGLPRLVRVKSEKLYQHLLPVARALDLGLERAPALPQLDPARAALHEHMDGIPPSSPLVDANFDEEEGDFEEESFGEKLALPFPDIDITTALHEQLGRPDYPQILRDQTIDEEAPGTMLRDFAALLESIGPRGIELTASTQVPKGPFMAALNERLVHPLQVDLKRPQAKSFPHCMALYLLLRASGLSALRRGRLCLDEEVLESWQTLNPTERYFALLEAWVLRGTLDIVGERTNPFFTPISQWLTLSTQIPAEGLLPRGREPLVDRFRYSTGPIYPALMELFGLLYIDHAPPRPGRGWHIARIQRTPLGDALLLVILTHLQNAKPDEDEEAPATGVLQPALRPYFPQWRRNLALREAEFASGLHIYKITLDRAWRRIGAPAECTLHEFAATIVAAFDFDFDHLYAFTVPTPFGNVFNINHPSMEEDPSADEILVGHLPIHPGEHIVFLYDFGDDWRFDLELEKVDPDSRRRKPTVLEEKGKPPEQYPDWE